MTILGEAVRCELICSQDELFSNTNNHIDLRFCMDIFVSCYKMLIMFHQSKKGNRTQPILSERTLEIARASMIMIQKIVGSSTNQYWGIRYVQFCTTIIYNAQSNVL